MTGVDVEHTKDAWIERRFRNLLGPGLASAVQALEQAEAEWPDSTEAALVASVERVQALHIPGPAPSSSKYCCECADLYPCNTIRALETPK